MVGSVLEGPCHRKPESQNGWKRRGDKEGKAVFEKVQHSTSAPGTIRKTETQVKEGLNLNMGLYL